VTAPTRARPVRRPATAMSASPAGGSARGYGCRTTPAGSAPDPRDQHEAAPRSRGPPRARSCPRACATIPSAVPSSARPGRCGVILSACVSECWTRRWKETRRPWSWESAWSERGVPGRSPSPSIWCPAGWWALRAQQRAAGELATEVELTATNSDVVTTMVTEATQSSDSSKAPKPLQRCGPRLHRRGCGTRSDEQASGRRRPHPRPTGCRQRQRLEPHPQLARRVAPRQQPTSRPRTLTGVAGRRNREQPHITP